MRHKPLILQANSTVSAVAVGAGTGRWLQEGNTFSSRRAGLAPPSTPKVLAKITPRKPSESHRPMPDEGHSRLKL